MVTPATPGTLTLTPAQGTTLAFGTSSPESAISCCDSFVVLDSTLVGAIDDTIVAHAFLDSISADQKTGVLLPGTVITMQPYAIGDGGHLDLVCLGGTATMKVPAKTYHPLFKRNLGTPASGFFRLRNLVLQGNGKEGTEQQIVAASWHASDTTQRWVQISDVSNYATPSTGYPYPPAAPEVNAYHYLAGPNERADFTYSATPGTLGANKLGPVDTDLTSMVGWYVNQSASKGAITLYNTSDVLIEDCEIYDWHSHAMQLRNGLRKRVRGNRVERCGTSPFGSNVISVIADPVHQPSDGAAVWGHDWVQDNYIKDSVQAPIAVYLNGPNTPGVITPLKCHVTGNEIQDVTNFVGIDLETNENTEVTISGNKIFGAIGGINCVLGSRWAGGTAAAQTVSAGGTLTLSSGTSRNLDSSGQVLCAAADGTATVLTYTGTGAASLTGVTPAITLFGDETLVQTNEKKRVVVVGNIVDDESITAPADSSPTKSGIRVTGGHAVVTGNYVRYRGLADGIQLNGNSGGAYSQAIRVADNVVVIANADTSATPTGLTASKIAHSQIDNNTILRENPDATASGMAEGIKVQDSLEVAVTNNHLVAPGTSGIHLVTLKGGVVEHNRIHDAGSQSGGSGGGNAAAILFGSDCWDVRVLGNRSRYSGSGPQYGYGCKVANEGGQEIELEHNSFLGWATAATLDSQSTTGLTVSGAQTVVAGGNAKLSALSNVPLNGGIATIGGVDQSYNRAVASVTGHVKGAQTISNGQNLNVGNVANLPDQSAAITISPTTVAWTSVDRTNNRLNNVTLGTSPSTFAAGASFTVTNIICGLSTGGAPLANGTTVEIDANSFVTRLDNRTARIQPPSETVTGTTYTLVLADANKVKEFTNGSAVTATVPASATSLGFAVGDSVELFQYGAGQVTVAAAGGVTIRSPGGKLKLASQYASAVLRYRGADEWALEGDIST